LQHCNQEKKTIVNMHSENPGISHRVALSEFLSSCHLNSKVATLRLASIPDQLLKDLSRIHSDRIGRIQY